MAEKSETGMLVVKLALEKKLIDQEQVDRCMELVKKSGKIGLQATVEEVLLKHPAVAECSVVGRPHPEWGEEVVAFVVRSGDVSAQQLDALCLEHIARFKRPREYRFVDALPKNNYGKVLKTELRRLATA